MKIYRPVSDQFRISSPFGGRTDPVTKKSVQYHKGIDFACPEGSEVRAIVDGRIERIGWEDENDPHKGFGLRIWQTYEDDTGTKYGVVYGHLSCAEVKEHMQVKQGEVIALSGNTGRSTGPHLHVGIRRWGSDEWTPIEV